MTLLKIQKQQVTLGSDPENRLVYLVEVQCPYYPAHGVNIIHMHDKPAVQLPSGWNIWHFEKKGENRILLQPSIGLHLVKPHTDDCHLSGEYNCIWG